MKKLKNEAEQKMGEIAELYFSLFKKAVKEINWNITHLDDEYITIRGKYTFEGMGKFKYPEFIETVIIDYLIDYTKDEFHADDEIEVYLTEDKREEDDQIEFIIHCIDFKHFISYLSTEYKLVDSDKIIESYAESIKRQKNEIIEKAEFLENLNKKLKNF
ncbi:MAG: hypothetical protein ACOC3V_01815 [bacterium]